MKPLDFKNFYAALGERYDAMTSDANRWEKEKADWEMMFSSMKPRKILVAGSGTGGEAITLAKFGFDVTAVDAVSEFVNISKSKCSEANVSVENIQDDLRSLERIQDESIDLLICRGNTLPHFLELDDLKSALKAFKRVLSKNSIVIIQWLNYNKVLKNKQRLIGSKGDGDLIFTRFYDILDSNRLNFNILVHSKNEKWKLDWFQTTLTAWSADDVGMLMVNTGWKSLEIASNLQRDMFDPDESDNVVLIAMKN